MSIRQISPERVEILKKYGFQESTIQNQCDMAEYFDSPIYFYDTKMLVTGDHATDYATLIYAEDNGRCGLFYAPSMLQYLLIDFGGEWDVNRLMRDLKRFSDCSLKLEFVGGLAMIFVELDDYAFKKRGIDYQVSDMLKVIGQLDYILPRKREGFFKKRQKEQEQKGL